MQRMKVPRCFGSMFFSMLFLPMSTQTTQGQAPAPGASVAVRMVEALDSSKDPAGKQYRACITKPVDVGNGVTIPQGTAAAVTLANSAAPPPPSAAPASGSMQCQGFHGIPDGRLRHPVY